MDEIRNTPPKILQVDANDASNPKIIEDAASAAKSLQSSFVEPASNALSGNSIPEYSSSHHVNSTPRNSAAEE